MTNDTPTSETTTVAVVSAAAENPENDIPAEPVDSHYSKSQTAIQSLSAILPSIPPSLSTSPNPSHSLLHDPQVSTQISALLHHPSSGTGDNHLCRWLYDTFQSGDPHLQLVVIRFVPVIACAYLSRATLRRPLAGFEAILLALYAHETTSRAGQPVTVNIPDMSHPSLYHEPTTPTKNNSTSLHLAVVSPSLEPHRTVRSTRRAWIVGVAMELYYSKIYAMPSSSKVEFCEFVRVWAGEQRDESEGESGPSELGEGKRISLPWELMQPIMRILGHCVVGCGRNKEIFDAAMAACKGLHGRAVRDINPKAILATESLLRLGNISLEPDDDAVDDIDSGENDNTDNDSRHQQLDSADDESHMSTDHDNHSREISDMI